MLAHNSNTNSILYLFLPFKIPCNAKSIKTMKIKLFDTIYPKIQHAGKEMMKNNIIPSPSIKEGMKIH